LIIYCCWYAPRWKIFAALREENVMEITLGDLSDARVVELLQYHFITARAHTPPGSAHALDLRGLQSPDITF
jgi:putative acetyltransferase